MKTKIVYCVPHLFILGGIERVITLKANYLADVLGYDVSIITADGGDRKPYFKLSSDIKVINLDINFDEIYKEPFLKQISQYFIKQKRFKKKLKETLFKIHPDITISLVRREINFINSIHDGSIKLGEIHVNKMNSRKFRGEKTDNSIKRLIEKYLRGKLIKKLRKLDQFIVINQEDKEQWYELNNVTVISNPLPSFPTKKSDCSTHQVIAVGRHSYQKGFDLLINSWNLVSKKHPDWILKIYGEGEGTELNNQIKSLNLEGTCILEHPVNNIVDKYCESSIFVLSSRYEGFGMVIAEAMSCGVPSVSFACPCGPRDIIKDKIDGLLAEPENISDLAEKICYLIENESVRKEMGEKARINVQRYRIENIMSQWDKLFKSRLKKYRKQNNTLANTNKTE